MLRLRHGDCGSGGDRGAGIDGSGRDPRSGDLRGQADPLQGAGEENREADAEPREHEGGDEEPEGAEGAEGERDDREAGSEGVPKRNVLQSGGGHSDPRPQVPTEEREDHAGERKRNTGNGRLPQARLRGLRLDQRRKGNHQHHPRKLHLPDLRLLWNHPRKASQHDLHRRNAGLLQGRPLQLADSRQEAQRNGRSHGSGWLRHHRHGPHGTHQRTTTLFLFNNPFPPLERIPQSHASQLDALHRTGGRHQALH